ncbi:5-methyltetrahydropteroyltriglutamate--homocysteine S-methyltransferase [Zhihengliuella flava]|uniref:5-methyltetrahydropteroyltriglutamate--homocysteine S-methyltransferase n=1 Tax=Zhihengliuella flava TaxID=1285193 RepID=A0A931DB11_9MICC|nr:5-methyltetrahydropteroyltriglutamate--homocysteine S-methyltransferase [Zhihengliuella flava]MBG6084241.1 5-methyltetrahydropteroyltriglutamate--homocysteine methyltransferase [Zhihengliuella flava]
MTTFPNATILGYPRIGPRRELKRAVESYWAGRSTEAELESAAASLQDATVERLRALGLTESSAIPADFALYDQVLDTTAALGALPARFADLAGPGGEIGLDAYFTLARGDAERAPLEMTKWFDTNYHYLVPEIGPETSFAALADRLAGIVRRHRARGATLRPVLVGPVTYLLLAKAADGAPETFRPIDRLNDVVAAYRGVIAQLADAGADWVQLDEPALTTEHGSAHVDDAVLAYRELADAAGYDAGTRPGLFVTTGYGTAGDPAAPGQALAELAAAGVDAVHADLVRGARPGTEALQALGDTRFVAGIVDGRNVWRNDLAASADLLTSLEADASVATSTSLLHVPHDVAAETNLPSPLPHWLAFADQKVSEVLTLAAGVEQGPNRSAEVAAQIQESEDAKAERAAAEGVRRAEVRQRTAAITTEDATRADAADRAAAQAERLSLPALPTTTIGSFPQTGEVRKARAAHRAGSLTNEEYDEFLRAEIKRVIDLQEEIGLDVLVHGEPERNDMVQYFAENFDGFAATEHGWVQSYGSRCTRPSILWGDVSRPEAFTVPWIEYAQSLTQKPVKGMLTGPVTILAWSFVRNDQPLAETANQVALALRDEVADLEAAGIAAIQVDEPALRELLPLRAADQPAYLDWSVNAFRLATSSVRVDTQIHTHLCYSEFGEVISGIDGLNADVTSIEAARSKMEVAADLQEFGFGRGVGPGVYDIHSPRVPSAGEVEELLRIALASVGERQLWVNPDCGLKTRGYEETVASLKNLVAATASVRSVDLAAQPA